LLILIGFVTLIAWAGAVINGFPAIASAQPGKHADRKARAGGLLGVVWDD
jgi:hypothetical protein